MMAWLEKILGKKSVESYIEPVTPTLPNDMTSIAEEGNVPNVAEHIHLTDSVQGLMWELEALMAEPRNQGYWCRIDPGTDSIKRLEALTTHYNGHIRQRAVMCLGLMGVSTALPFLIARANDWAWQVRDSARQSVRHFIRQEYATELVNYLPDLYKLLNGERDDHQKLINEIIEFLCKSENQSVILAGLESSVNSVARICLNIVLERQLLAEDEIFQRVMDHNDVQLRCLAVRLLLHNSQKMSRDILHDMLRDSYAVIKQLALNFAVEHNVDVHPQLLLQLLFDRNEIVRRRSANLLKVLDISPNELYLAVFNDEDKHAKQRATALLGLNEQKYTDTLELALKGLQSQNTKIYKTSLRLVVRYQQEQATDLLVNALYHPHYPIAKYAFQWIVKLKLYVSMPALLQCLNQAPSHKHARLCFNLSYRLNIWDALIFALLNIQKNNAELAREALTRSEGRIHRFSPQPKEAQKEQLLDLLKLHPEVAGKNEDYLQRLLSQ